MDKEYLIELSQDTQLYVKFKTERGKVKDFVVKLSSIIENNRYEIIRYDSYHNCPHKDILNTDGKVIRKVWFDYLTNEQALTIALEDIKDNFELYKERFQKWLKK